MSGYVVTLESYLTVIAAASVAGDIHEIGRLAMRDKGLTLAEKLQISKAVERRFGQLNAEAVQPVIHRSYPQAPTTQKGIAR